MRTERKARSVRGRGDDAALSGPDRRAPGGGGHEPAATIEPGNNPRLLQTKRPALAVLDLVLPGVDGIELIRTLPGLAEVPVIFVSAYGEGDTVARALEAEAPDYIVKPFSPAELAARLALVLRRHARLAPFRVGELELDRTKRRVPLAGQATRLTATEYRLLEALSLYAGGAATYEVLIRRVCSGKGGGSVGALRSAVAKLRRKLGGNARQPRYVIGERDLGYLMPRPATGREGNACPPPGEAAVTVALRGNLPARPPPGRASWLACSKTDAPRSRCSA